MERIHASALAQQKKRQDAGKTPLLEVPWRSKGGDSQFLEKVDPQRTSHQGRFVTCRLKSKALMPISAARTNMRDAESARIRRQIQEPPKPSSHPPRRHPRSEIR